MFEPKYQITDAVLNSIVKFEVVRSMVESVSLVEEWEGRLKQDALLRRIEIFAKISGIGLSPEVIGKIVAGDPERDEKVSEVAERLSVIGKEREIQQIINYINAVRYADHLIFLSSKFRDFQCTEKELRQLNAILGERIYRGDILGVLRIREAVGDNFSFVPAVEVSYLLEDVMSWLMGSFKREKNKLIDCGVLLYELVRILPFEENGLVTVFEYLRMIMSIDGYQIKKIWYLEEDLLKNEQVFWEAISSVEKNNGDMTHFLEFFTKSVADGSDRLKTRLTNLVGELPKFRTETGKIVALSERQIAIMEEVTVRGEMTIKELRDVLPLVSDDTILRDLKDLLAKKMIKKRGKTKGAVYVLGKIKSFK